LKIRVKESGNLRETLANLSQRANALGGQHEIPLTELMSPEFVANCSSYATLQELFAASPFEINSIDDFKSIPDTDWDLFIGEHTSFSSWHEMQQAAVREWTRQKLGFK
jgi:hypothetical protein